MTAATLVLIGRVVFGAFFLVAGIRNFLHFGERRELPTNYGWKLPAPIMAVGFAVQLVGGLALVLGFWTVPAAIALIVFLVLATRALPQPLPVPGQGARPASLPDAGQHHAGRRAAAGDRRRGMTEPWSAGACSDCGGKLRRLQTMKTECPIVDHPPVFRPATLER